MSKEQIAAFKAAMRDMRRENVDVEIISVREYENRVRPNELSDKLVNGRPIFC